ncbi:MAG: hypothetical protein A2033_14095 [Bacteroidetes bacterium GWA2_31_9]|nr:MAG: hypothetical protein A2033_14095 [Bacteroidetes bacterium GWA2_31_9]
MKTFFLIIFFSIYVSSNAMHPLHISFTNIDYDETTSKLKISVKFFSDDFQNMFIHNYNKEINFDVKLTDDKIDAINKFLMDNFMLSVNKNDLTKDIKFVDSKTNFESTWLNFEIDFKGKIKTLIFSNKTFFDVFSDQTNLLIFKYKDIEEGFQITKNNQTISITI